MAKPSVYDSDVDDNENDVDDNENTEEVPQENGPRVVERFRLHHAFGGTYTDFDNESDLLDFVNSSTKVEKRRNPDGSTTDVFSPNQHLVHGAAHPDYPNLRVERVSEVVFPEDDE